VCRTAAGDPLLLATDLVDYLVRKGVPFRQAHHAVGSAVALAERLGKRINQLRFTEFQSADPNFDVDVIGIFDLGKAMSRRETTGAPGANEVRKQLEKWNRTLRS
jgi:argininosuccinate lyase